MAVLSNDILSSTLRELMKDEVDQLFKTTPALDHFQSAGGLRIIDGGQKINQPLILDEHSTITQLTSGYEATNLAVKDVLRQAEFDWADYVMPVVITKKEELSNSGPRAIVDIAEARLKSVLGTFRREWERQVVAGDSAVMTELNTLNGGTGAATGFLEPRVTQTNTVGGLARGTYTDLYNQFVDSASSFATTGIDDMTNLYIGAQLRTPDGSPDLILSSQASYAGYKKLLYANERFVGEKALDGGRLALQFHGAMMYVNPWLPVNAGATQISMYFINSKHIKAVFDSRANFTLTDFEKLSGYTSRSADVLVRTQIVFDHLLSSGVLGRAES